jgi:hypothetical protein
MIKIYFIISTQYPKYKTQTIKFSHKIKSVEEFDKLVMVWSYNVPLWPHTMKPAKQINIGQRLVTKNSNQQTTLASSLSRSLIIKYAKMGFVNLQPKWQQIMCFFKDCVMFSHLALSHFKEKNLTLLQLWSKLYN